MTQSDKSSAVPQRHESDVYDRQIRLWGAEAQAKMAQAKVLYIHITGVSSEILKNLVLAGIRAVLLDPRPYPESVRTTPSFFLCSADRESVASREESSSQPLAGTVAEAVQAKVEELNPLLGSCEVIKDMSLEDLFTSPLHTSSSDQDQVHPSTVHPLLLQCSLVVASRLSASQASRLAQATVAAGGKFFLADSFGLEAGGILDWGPEHWYRPEVGKNLLDATLLSPRVALTDILQVPLSHATNRFHKTPPPVWIRYRCLLALADLLGAWPDDISPDQTEALAMKLRQWLQETAPSALDHEALTVEALKQLIGTAAHEIAPVCSILGGMLGNEVIKAISGKGEPANNTLLLDGMTCKVLAFLVMPKVGQ